MCVHVPARGEFASPRRPLSRQRVMWFLPPVASRRVAWVWSRLASREGIMGGRLPRRYSLLTLYERSSASGHSSHPHDSLYLLCDLVYALHSYPSWGSGLGGPTDPALGSFASARCVTEHETTRASTRDNVRSHIPGGGYVLLCGRCYYSRCNTRARAHTRGAGPDCPDSYRTSIPSLTIRVPSRRPTALENFYVYTSPRPAPSRAAQ